MVQKEFLEAYRQWLASRERAKGDQTPPVDSRAYPSNLRGSEDNRSVFPEYNDTVANEYQEFLQSEVVQHFLEQLKEKGTYDEILFWNEALAPDSVIVMALRALSEKYKIQFSFHFSKKQKLIIEVDRSQALPDAQEKNIAGILSTFIQVNSESLLSRNAHIKVDARQGKEWLEISDAK